MRYLARVQKRMRRMGNAGPWAGNPIGPDQAQIFVPSVVDSSWSLPGSAFTFDTDTVQCFNVSAH